MSPIQAPEILNSSFHPGVIFNIALENASGYIPAMRKAPWHSKSVENLAVETADKIVLPQPNIAEVAIFDPELALKRQFAEFLLFNPHDAKGAAARIAKGDFAKQYFCELLWPEDSAVIDHQIKLIAEKGEEHFLPTKGKMVHRLWADSRIYDPRESVNAIRLAAELAGYLNKNADGINGGQLINQNISISFVSPQKEEVKIIEETVIDLEETNPLPNLKFVS